VEWLRRALTDKLSRSPGDRAFTWRSGSTVVRVRHLSGEFREGTDLRLSFAPQARAIHAAGSSATAGMGLPKHDLPDVQIYERGLRNVGLDGAIDTVILHWQSLWDGRLDEISHSSGQAVPESVRSYLQHSGSLFIFCGDPGTGKTVAAETAADRYARTMGIDGQVIRMTAATRGQGLVASSRRRS